MFDNMLQEFEELDKETVRSKAKEKKRTNKI